MKCKKACGSDGIPSEALHSSLEVILPVITLTLNYMLDMGNFPDCWIEGLIFPIHKGGDKKDPSNYRRITVLPSMGKLFETLVNNRLVFMKDVFNMEDKFNGGFKKNSSTSDNMFLLVGAIQRAEFLKQPLYVAFVDFKRAFDTVNRNMLFYKLVKKQIDGNLIRLLYDMYNKTKSKICTGGLLSELLHDTLGVNQGGPNSPDMFKGFLDDIGDYLNKKCGIVISNELLLLHLLWADDLILMSNTPEGLQTQLDQLLQYCSDWQMIVNILKTKVMIFGSKKASNQPHIFHFNHQVIEVTKQYKYLGAIFSSESCLFNKHLDGSLSSALKASFKVLKFCKCLGQVPPIVAMKLFNSLVLPIILYGCEIWFPLINQTLRTKLNVFQMKNMKSILKVKQSTANLCVYGDLGEYPIDQKIICKTIKYWIRIVNLPKDNIVKQMYTVLEGLHHIGHKTWVSQVKDIMEKAELAELWTDVPPKKTLSKYIRHHLESIFRQHWLDEINNSVKNSKLRLYKEIKYTFMPEPYLFFNIPKFRYAISRLRLSSHHLEIETGRYTRPLTPANQRFCAACPGKVGDEYHFLTECVSHSENRNILFDEIKRDIPNFLTQANKEKFISILTSQNMNVLLSLAKFIVKAWG